jgi:hypothetical protein
MKFRKTIFIIIGVFVLVLSSIVVSAETETDATGDVYNWKMVDSTWSWKPSTEPKAHIDITELGYTSSGNQITLTLKVSGEIQSNENVAYIAWVNTSDATYQLYWMNGSSFSMGINTAGGTEFDMNPDITVSGNSISCTFNLVGTDDTSDEFWGTAMEYTEFGSTNQEWWGDWIPGTYAPFQGQGGEEDDEGEGDGNGDTNGEGDTNGDGSGNGSSGTPGFELVAVLTAIAISLIILRRRK